MNAYQLEHYWLKANGLNSGNFVGLPFNQVQAQKIAHNLLKYNSNLLQHNEASTLNNFLNAMTFTKQRNQLTESDCFKVMNIGKVVNRELFKAHKALKR